MKTNYTSVPLRYHRGRGAKPRFHIQTTGGYQVASTPPISLNGAEAAAQEANAMLFSAAPDLVEALDNVLRYCVCVRGFPDKAHGRTAEQQSAFDAALAALKKAGVGH